MMGGYSWVTLATNDSYSLGALVLAHSLKQVGTKQHLSVLITPGVTNAMRSKLSEVFNVVQEVNVLDSKDEANLRLLKRPELGVTFTKLHCWRLTQFDKCVFLDADTLVLENCDELFDREELSAAPDIGWPDCFNSGVFVYRPSNETYEKLIEFALEKGSFDGGDQGLLNLYFSDWAHKDISKHLPFIYNMASTACYSYLPAFKQFGAMAKIIHFIGSSKPWLQYFDTETKQVQPSQGYEHLKMILQHWWDIFCSMIHPCLSPDMAGIAGAFAKLTLGQPRTAEQLALDDHLRRQGWEVGKIDYLGRDSFDNIWTKICETLSSAPTVPEQKNKDPSSSRSEVKPLEQSLTEESLSQTQVISLSSTDLGITSEALQALSKQTPNVPPTEHSPLLPPDLSTHVESSKLEDTPETKPSTQSQPATERPETMSDTKEPSQQVDAESKLVAESEQIVKEGFKPKSEPPKALSESSKLVSELQKPIVETPTPVTPPQKPATEPATSITELPTPVTESPTPVAEPSKAVAEPPKAVAESPKAVAEPPKAVAEPPKVVAEPPKTVAEPPKAVAEPPKAIAEPPKAVAEPPKAVAEPPKAIAEPPKAIAEPPKASAESPKAVAEPPKPVVESPKPDAKPPKPVADPPKPVVEPPKSVIGISAPAAEPPQPATECSKLEYETPKSVTEQTNTTAETPKITTVPQKPKGESPKPTTELSKSTVTPVGEQSRPFQAEKSVSEGCSVKSKHTSSGESKDSRKGKGIPKTQVPETTPPTSPVSPQPKQTLNVDTSIPDTPPPAAQESATAGPTPPPRKGSSGTKKTGTKTKK